MRISVSLVVNDQKVNHVTAEEIVEVASDKDPNGAVIAAVNRVINKAKPIPDKWQGNTVIEIERLIE